MNNSGFAIALGPVRKKNNGAYKPRAYDPDGTVAAKRGGKIVFERAHRNEEHSLKHYKNISREVLAFMKEHNLEDVPPETFFRKNGEVT